MDTGQLAEKTVEVLRPFETANLMNTIQNLTLHRIFTNPVVVLVISAVFFFGVIKRSKTVLLTLFALIGLIVTVRFAMPAPGEELTVKSLLPFAACGLGIGGVIIYFSLIKSD